MQKNDRIPGTNLNELGALVSNFAEKEAKSVLPELILAAWYRGPLASVPNGCRNTPFVLAYGRDSTALAKQTCVGI
eukprot:3709588-Rhodomonas_salina.2